MFFVSAILVMEALHLRHKQTFKMKIIVKFELIIKKIMIKHSLKTQF